MTYFDIKNDYVDWLKSTKVTFDLAICLHAPNHLKAVEHGFDEDWLRRKLTHYFNVLDRKLFKLDHKKRGKRMQRFVVLGHTDTVGWHAHICVATPERISQKKLIALMHLLWLKHMHINSTANTKFKRKLFWAEEINAGYVKYSNDNANDLSSIKFGHAHTVDKGTVDILNCHF